jgi:hypothetical protein
MTLENSVPANTFEVVNLADRDSFVYLGKTAMVDNTNGNTVVKDGSNCLATFLMGSLVPGRNIRIDIPTETDPNVFVDAKFFDFQSYSPTLSASSVLGSVSSLSGDMSYFFRSITNDGSPSGVAWIVIEADDDSFYIGYDGVAYYKQADGSYSTTPVATNPDSLVLKTHGFTVNNTVDYTPGLYTHKDVDQYGNTTLYLNQIIAGNCLKIKDTGDTLQLMFDQECARVTPCCDDPLYSGAGIDDPVSVSSVTPPENPCSLIANTYLLGFDFKKNAKLSEVTCEGGFCNWSLDSYTFTATSANYDLHDPLSPIVPYYIRSGWYYRIKAEEMTDPYFVWNMRVIKYTTYYRDCVDDEFSDYTRPFTQDWDQQERKVVRQDVEMLVLTHATSGFFDMFTRDNILQPSGNFVYNEELTQEWIEETQAPIYMGSTSSEEHLELNVSELFLDGPHYDSNTNTHALVDAWTNCGPYIPSSSSSISDSESMGPLVSTSSQSSESSESSSSSSSPSSDSSNSSSSSSSSLSSSSPSSLSSYSVSQSSQSSL